MNIEEKIIDLLHGEVTAKDRDEIMQVVNNDAGARKLYQDYKRLFDNTHLISKEEQIPRAAIKSNILTLIDNQKKEAASPRRVINMRSSLMVKISSVAAILMVGLFIGQYMISHTNDQAARQEIAMLRSQIEANIHSPSISTRIKAVNYSKELESHDPTILDVIIKTAKEDTNPNVRLAAVQALGRHIQAMVVPQALGLMLLKEKDPAVQIAIIESLSQVKSDKILQALERITLDEETPQFVKDEAHNGIFKLQDGEVF